MIYCILPEELAAELHDLLRRHFRSQPGIEVVVERRAGERRRGERREAGRAAPVAERRGQRRRARERRTSLVEVAPPAGLPPRVRFHLARIRFLERSEPANEPAEDRDSARLVRAFQRGDDEAFSGLYLRYFDRIYAYMRVVLRDNHEAEDATQQVFVKLYEALPRYEERGQPFRAFLFVVARNHAISELRRRQRLHTFDPVELELVAGPAMHAEAREFQSVGDRDLLALIERLPLGQRQVVVLRFMLDLSHAQIGQVLDRTPEDVRALLYRALTFMRTRLRAVRCASEGGGGVQRLSMRRRPPSAPVAIARRRALTG